MTYNFHNYRTVKTISKLTVAAKLRIYLKLKLAEFGLHLLGDKFRLFQKC